MSTTLRGMHHLVSCVDELDQTFSVVAVNATQAIVTGSTSVVREPPTGKCSAVELDMRVRPDGKGFVLISFPVTNRSDAAWNASVILKIDGLRTSVPVGQLSAGEKRTKTVRVRLTQELKSITGTLVVGP